MTPPTTPAAWTTTELRADDLRVGDLYDRDGLRLPVTWVESVYDVTQFGVMGRAFQVPRDKAVTVHVPDEPVDGYDLWRPKPGTWTYGGCTCVHRRLPDAGNWAPVGRDCPACVLESDPYRDDD